MVPFSKPSTGPVSAEETSAFDKFEENLHTHYYSSSIGWIVGLQKAFRQSKTKIQEIREELLQNSELKIRNTNGWALVLFFLEQVRRDEKLDHIIHNCQHHTFLYALIVT